MIIYVSNNPVTTFIKQKLQQMQGNIKTLIMGDFNIPQDRSSEQTIIHMNKSYLRISKMFDNTKRDLLTKRV